MSPQCLYLFPTITHESLSTLAKHVFETLPLSRSFNGVLALVVLYTLHFAEVVIHKILETCQMQRFQSTHEMRRAHPYDTAL